MLLARAVHFDQSDQQVFHRPARTGEWAISGGFEFSNWTEADLSGKARQAFVNGWLGLETFGRVTFVAVSAITPAEQDALTQALAQHFVDLYGAPSPEAALPTAREELAQMADLCADHAQGTVLTVLRHLTESGLREEYRFLQPEEADLSQFALHGSLDA